MAGWWQGRSWKAPPTWQDPQRPSHGPQSAEPVLNLLVACIDWAHKLALLC